MIEAPEIAAHFVQRWEVSILRQFELLLEVDDLFARFNLQELCFGNFDHDSVTVGPLQRVLLLEHFDQVFDLARE